MSLTHWKAALYSTRAGRYKKALGYCEHKHGSKTAASNCARRLNRQNFNSRVWWQLIEIAMRPVKAEP